MKPRTVMAIAITGMCLLGQEAFAVTVPQPKASQGAYYDYIKVTWPTVEGVHQVSIKWNWDNDYSSAQEVGFYGVSHGYWHSANACSKYYFWVVIDGKADPRKYAVGWTKKYAKILYSNKNTSYGNPDAKSSKNLPSTIKVGSKYRLLLNHNDGCAINPLFGKWVNFKIKSGTSRAKIDSKGYLRALKPGTIVLEGSTAGATWTFKAKKTIKIVER